MTVAVEWPSAAPGTVRFPSTDVVPNQIASLVAWYEVQRLALADNAAIASLTDLSGNGNHAVQGTAGNRPVNKTGILNGLAVARFTAASLHCLQTAAFGASLAQPSTIFAVANCSSIAANRNICDGIATSDRHLIQVTPTTHVLFGGASGSTGVSATGARIYVAQFNNASSFLRLNGTQGSNVTAGTNALTGLTIGARFDGAAAPSGFMEGDIAEVILYNRALSTAEMRKIERYLGRKYGLAVAA